MIKNKLTEEEIQDVMVGIKILKLDDICAMACQLLDTMRDNEGLLCKLKIAKNYFDTDQYWSAQTAVEDALSSCKQSDDSCKECGAVHNGSSEGLRCQYINPSVY